jgi:lipoprotein-releasing system permease protein
MRNILQKLKLELWLALKLIFSVKNLLSGSAMISFLGLVLGVACLIVSMSVVSGYEHTLSKTMSDVTGHMIVVKRSRDDKTAQQLADLIKEQQPQLLTATAFLRTEALLAHQGQVRGLLLQGVPVESRDQVLNLSDRLIEGSLNLEQKADNQLPKVLIGKGIAATFKLHPGDEIRLILPISDSLDASKFSRRMQSFEVAGILDLGKYEWNERLVMTDLKPLQALAAVGSGFTGLMLKYKEANLAQEQTQRVRDLLGTSYSVTNWYELNENLFEAVKLERVIIFLVIYVIVIIAAFNIASTLFVHVIKRAAEIALLRSLGISQASILRIFGMQGLVYGVLGFFSGTFLGFLLSLLVTQVQKQMQLMSAAVYRIEGIMTYIRLQDVFIIGFSTCMICLIASLAPAWRGARLSAVEGLRR